MQVVTVLFGLGNTRFVETSSFDSEKETRAVSTGQKQHTRLSWPCVPGRDFTARRYRTAGRPRMKYPTPCNKRGHLTVGTEHRREARPVENPLPHPSHTARHTLSASLCVVGTAAVTCQAATIRTSYNKVRVRTEQTQHQAWRFDFHGVLAQCLTSDPNLSLHRSSPRRVRPPRTYDEVWMLFVLLLSFVSRFFLVQITYVTFREPIRSASSPCRAISPLPLLLQQQVVLLRTSSRLRPLLGFLLAPVCCER